MSNHNAWSNQETGDPSKGLTHYFKMYPTTTCQVRSALAQRASDELEAARAAAATTAAPATSVTAATGSSRRAEQPLQAAGVGRGASSVAGGAVSAARVNPTDEYLSLPPSQVCVEFINTTRSKPL